MQLSYQSGFGNHFESEAIPGSLPKGQNSPQKTPFGLYAEQLSGSAFTALRPENLRSWLYRIRPSVVHSPFKQTNLKNLRTAPLNEVPTSPNQMRWSPLDIPKEKTDFLDGLHTLVASGNVAMSAGCAVHLYACNISMQERYFYNSDGELLIVPQAGGLLFKTEFGNIEAQPTEIVVIPRGVKFQVILLEKSARGYVCENYGTPFQLPYLGPIGSNGLAAPRDFLYPAALYENLTGRFKLFTKFQGELWESQIDRSPLDIVAWHGNYAPYKYDLKKFNTINSVSFDHCDPSIFTVLTSPSTHSGVANVDFVIFPPRWITSENTFRPPYFHRNVMSEFMGLIEGQYDAKQDGFIPGGSSLHNCMSAHGPDTQTYLKATKATLKPQYMKKTMAFMFETNLVFKQTKFAIQAKLLQKDYHECWSGLKPSLPTSKNTSLRSRK